MLIRWTLGLLAAGEATKLGFTDDLRGSVLALEGENEGDRLGSEGDRLGVNGTRLGGEDERTGDGENERLGE